FAQIQPAVRALEVDNAEFHPAFAISCEVDAVDIPAKADSFSVAQGNLQGRNQRIGKPETELGSSLGKGILPALINKRAQRRGKKAAGAEHEKGALRFRHGAFGQEISPMELQRLIQGRESLVFGYIAPIQKFREYLFQRGIRIFNSLALPQD